MLRAVVDTNVLVSALLSDDSMPARIRKAFRDGEMVWCLSEELFAEYRETLRKPRLVKAFAKVRGGLADEFLSELAKAAEWVREIRILPVVADDPDDDIVVATAVAARAEAIVTGDDDLLRLGEHGGIRIVPPRRFVELLGEGRQPARP